MTKRKTSSGTGKKSIIYELVIGILSLVFVILVCVFVGALLEKDYDFRRDADSLYYNILSTKYYSPFDIYEFSTINRALDAKEDEDLVMIYAYGDYYMDSFHYYALTDKEKKERYKEKRDKDIEAMGEIRGLSNRIDRILNN